MSELVLGISVENNKGECHGHLVPGSGFTKNTTYTINIFYFCHKEYKITINNSKNYNCKCLKV